MDLGQKGDEMISGRKRKREGSIVRYFGTWRMQKKKQEEWNKIREKREKISLVETWKESKERIQEKLEGFERKIISARKESKKGRAIEGVVLAIKK